jgi:hypothetical protein
LNCHKQNSNKATRHQQAGLVAGPSKWLQLGGPDSFCYLFFVSKTKKVKKKQRITKRGSNLNNQSSQIRKYKPVIKYLRNLRQQEQDLYFNLGYNKLKSRIKKAETTMHKSSTKLYVSNGLYSLLT